MQCVAKDKRDIVMSEIILEKTGVQYDFYRFKTIFREKDAYFYEKKSEILRSRANLEIWAGRSEGVFTFIRSKNKGMPIRFVYTGADLIAMGFASQS
jgi:hypothetical protein